jgi:hypothetical protein
MGGIMTGPRIERQVVLASLEDAEGFRCVDLVRLPDGMFVFKEFRRDPEDSGRWTLVADYSHMKFGSQAEALEAARANISWFAQQA